MRPLALAAVLTTTLLSAASAHAAKPAGFIGSLHEHSAYSDGYPTTRPATYYANGKAHGLDFMGGSDHSDTLGLPISVSQDCEDDPTQSGCAIADTTTPTDSFRKWDATAEQATAATTSAFTA